MFVHAIPATAFGTNCWVVAPREVGSCVVVDPGFGVLEPLHRLLGSTGLTPAAVVVTHGHADHVWSVTPVARSAGDAVAVHVHHDDRYRLADPVAALDPSLVALLEAQLGAAGRWREPETVVSLPASPDGEVDVPAGGLVLRVRHTPGHTEGSVCLRLAGGGDRGEDLLLPGDLLFAGSIGRSDLPGGDPVAMRRSLATVMAEHDDDTLVLPGHGPTTTIGRERASNPYLAAAPPGTAGAAR